MMFQSFEDKGSSADSAARVAALRAAMAERGAAAFVVPLADAHQGEYVAECDARLAWLTGFTGSAGFAVVTPDRAAIFVDGRYRVQVRAQVDLDIVTPVDWPEVTLADWCKEHGLSDLALDPWLHTAAEVARLEEAGITVTPVENLVDAVWPARPARPQGPARVQPDALAGRSHGEKRAEIAGVLREAGQAAAVITLTDSLSWLLNLRGSDIPRNPIVQGFAVIHADDIVDLFTGASLSPEVVAHLGDQVRLHSYDAFGAHLSTLSGPTRVDRDTAPWAVARALETVSDGRDPCMMPKARKTPAELEGMRAAHDRDGLAMIRFLAWLDRTAPGQLTEIDVVTQLESFRRDGGQLVDISFDTISGAGPNGAIIHYRVTQATNRPLAAGELLLVDSGAQYPDGTTDITRTIAIGQPTEDQRRHYTAVLQGMIALTRARFPKGTAGSNLDILARAPLWSIGQDYAHGTGHGVGAHLCVHEGPQSISRRGPWAAIPLEPGMILSNEPGFYREGAFGIRIENLIVVQAAPPLPDQTDHGWQSFETLTTVPLDRRLIDTAALTADDRAWIDSYHAEIATRYTGRLDEADASWLAQACAPLD